MSNAKEKTGAHAIRLALTGHRFPRVQRRSAGAAPRRSAPWHPFAVTVAAGAVLLSQAASAASVTVAADPLSPSVADAVTIVGDGYSAKAAASAQVGPGFGKLVAEASVDWNIQPGQNAAGIGALATASASSSDILTIDAGPDLNGQLGVLSFNSLLTFDLQTQQEVRGTAVNNSMTGTLYAYWDIRSPNYATVGGGCHFAFGAVTPSGFDCFGVDLSTAAPDAYEARGSYALVFIFGQPFELGLRSQAVAGATVGLQNAGTGGFAETLLDAGNSVYWDGITSVTTFEGIAVDYAVTSLSGADYRMSFAPVPEPSTSLLLASALALLPLLRKQWRRGQAHAVAHDPALGRVP